MGYGLVEVLDESRDSNPPRSLQVTIKTNLLAESQRRGEIVVELEGLIRSLPVLESRHGGGLSCVVTTPP